jgi:hypothetical protein
VAESLLMPAVVDALVELLSGAPPLGGVAVFDGPEVIWPEQVDLIAVGLAPENLSNSALRIPAGLVATSESVEVTCVARCWSGGVGVKARRDRAYRLLDGVVQAIGADPTLGGVCARAEVAGSIYLPFRTDKGLLVDVIFTVRARRF